MARRCYPVPDLAVIYKIRPYLYIISNYYLKNKRLAKKNYIFSLLNAKLTLKCRNANAFRALMGEALAAYNAAGWPGKVSVYLDFHSDADI